MTICFCNIRYSWKEYWIKMQFLIQISFLFFSSLPIFCLLQIFGSLSLSEGIPRCCWSDFHFSPPCRSVFPISQLSELTLPSITGSFIPRVPLLSACPTYVLYHCLCLCFHMAPSGSELCQSFFLPVLVLNLTFFIFYCFEQYYMHWQECMQTDKTTHKLLGAIPFSLQYRLVCEMILQV